MQTLDGPTIGRLLHRLVRIAVRRSSVDTRDISVWDEVDSIVLKDDALRRFRPNRDLMGVDNPNHGAVVEAHLERLEWPT
jgi:hypothetical protein